MIDYKGTLFAELDMDAILARKPRVVLVDELAHTNIPGFRHRKRYEDVLELLDANIDVISTVNIQHIESIAPTVRAITGVVVRETVPDWVLQVSDETVMVDLTPEALQNRMRRGDVYGKEKVEQALTKSILACRSSRSQVNRSAVCSRATSFSTRPATRSRSAALSHLAKACAIKSRGVIGCILSVSRTSRSSVA